MAQILKIALVGNPNTGKTSLFNQLTGLNQKVGNYPGITVDKKVGYCQLTPDLKAQILDLPGTYSINATSADEHIVFDTLVNDQNPDYPDVVVVVTEIENLKRNLFLFTQIKDLGIPTILVINMVDQLKKKGIQIDHEALEMALKTKVILMSARKNIGIDELKEAIINYPSLNTSSVADVSERIRGFFFEHIKDAFPQYSLYKSWLLITRDEPTTFITPEIQDKLDLFRSKEQKIKHFQHKEAIYRYQVIHEILKKTYQVDRAKGSDLRGILDRILTHKVFGYVIFAVVLMLIFQSVYAWASIPMDWIDTTFAQLSEYTKSQMPSGKFTDLLTDGIIPGIGGILIFIPQIAILFFFVAILEETGYMSRVVFLMDKIMRQFGMSGKSVLPLVSGTACAIPAIMSSRNIESWRERLITILVTPFVTCSARLPVYAILIALIIPEKTYYGIFNLQGLTLMVLYLLGFAAAFSSAMLLNYVLKIKNKSFFIIELPNYQIPSLKNIGLTVWDKTKAFVWEAGKIILAISIVLWFLASHGNNNFNQAEATIAAQNAQKNVTVDNQTLENQISSYKLEHSYLGQIGKGIEPVIRPLGYDWKIGIALISSFAAREVFVGTLATIYSVGDSSENTSTIKEQMKAEKDSNGKPIFNFATGISLLLFYAFAMQCMGTLAIVKRETNTWKWPVLQLTGMGLLAYLIALTAYQILH
ncbi:MAG: ferrous iron transport protein B [Flavobacteriaceae bacterium]|nr:ferrous iron transport protein B [Flavobacteriaceae bacterium]